ncbi:hypothetical protein [Streptomyces goshikiensis]|uniref:hypothetical protein n=1 Tax=Streptomyces goshikiensis TaxID=1942 RepID=UPI00367E5169
MPDSEPRLIVHELCFASAGGTRRNERLLILWMPPPAGATPEETYTAGYTALKELQTDIRVHLTARSPAQLEYRRLVVPASGGLPGHR